MFEQLLSVFLESRCPFCQRSSSKTVCQYCFNKLSDSQYQPRDRSWWWGDLPLFAWGRYEGQLKQAIALMKYRNHPQLGLLLGQLLAQAWLTSNLINFKQVSVVPIPLHPSKLKQRGFNQAEKIARGFCQVTGYSLQPHALKRVRVTEAMFSLSPEARKKNLQGAFALGKLPPHPVLLLDDIYTLGTTTTESAKVLRNNQIEIVGLVVAAKTSRL